MREVRSLGRNWAQLGAAGAVGANLRLCAGLAQGVRHATRRIAEARSLPGGSRGIRGQRQIDLHGAVIADLRERLVGVGLGGAQ